MKIICIPIGILFLVKCCYGLENNTLECDQTEKSLSQLDVALEMITKAKDNFPTRNDTLDCGKREKSLSYLDFAVEMITKVKKSLPIEPTNFTHIKPLDCEDLQLLGHNKSGIYTIWIRDRLSEEKSINVFCDMETDGGGWTLIQRRGQFGNAEDYFYRNWSSYKTGFGELDKEFWLGNDHIFALTNLKLYSVRLDLMAVDREKRYALYDKFWIDDENSNYTLHINNYSGNAGDSMENQNEMKFSTKDRDNDMDSRNCAETFKSGWWFHACVSANLNGLNVRGKTKIYADGIVWRSFKTLNESMETAEIKIRSLPRKNKL